jgi:hypothetical protein
MPYFEKVTFVSTSQKAPIGAFSLNFQNSVFGKVLIVQWLQHGRFSDQHSNTGKRRSALLSMLMQQ